MKPVDGITLASPALERHFRLSQSGPTTCGYRALPQSIPLIQGETGEGYVVLNGSSYALGVEGARGLAYEGHSTAPLPEGGQKVENNGNPADHEQSDTLDLSVLADAGISCRNWVRCDTNSKPVTVDVTAVSVRVPAHNATWVELQAGPFDE